MVPFEFPQKDTVNVHCNFWTCLLASFSAPFLPPVPIRHPVSSPVSSPITHSLLQPQRTFLNLFLCVCISYPFWMEWPSSLSRLTHQCSEGNLTPPESLTAQSTFFLSRVNLLRCELFSLLWKVPVNEINLFLLHCKMAAETFYSEFWLPACMEVRSQRTDRAEQQLVKLAKDTWCKESSAELGRDCPKHKNTWVCVMNRNSNRRWTSSTLEQKRQEGRWEDGKLNWRWKRWADSNPSKFLRSESKSTFVQWHSFSSSAKHWVRKLSFLSA